MEREVLQRSAAAPQAEAETSSTESALQTETIAPQAEAETSSAEIASQTETIAPQAAETLQTEANALQTGANAPQEEAPVPDFLAENPLGKREADILADYSSRLPSAVMAAGLLVVLALFSWLLGFSRGDTVYGVSLLVGAVAVAAFLFFVFPVLCRRNTEKSLVYTGASVRLTVFGEQLTLQTVRNDVVLSQMRLRVKDLIKVAEYRGCLLVFVAKSQASILSAEGFTVGSAQAFKAYCAARGVPVK